MSVARGTQWKPCACTSGYCREYTKAKHTWLCWYCEHDQCESVHRLPVVWEDPWDSPEYPSVVFENPEIFSPTAPEGTRCGMQGCEAVGTMWNCTVQGCDEVACNDHSIEDGCAPSTRHCLMCHMTDDAFSSCELPLRPVFCTCQVCGPSKEEKCIFNTWSRVPHLWTTGRLCFDCDVSHANSLSRCACTCGDPSVQRRERALKKVDETLAASTARPLASSA